MYPACASSSATPPASFAVVGKSCGMGSNLALCADDDSSSCDGNACLWDANGVSSKAYCTIACTPGDANACPAHFECKAQGCSSGPANVCVRTSVPAQPTCQPLAVDGRTFRTITTFGARDGRLYLIGSLGNPSMLGVFSRLSTDSTWTKISEVAYPRNGTNAKLFAAKDAVYVSLEQGQMLRISGTTAATETYEDCAQTHCYYPPSGIFATPTGAIRALIGSEGPVIERNADGTWHTVTEKLPRLASIIHSFPDGGFLARCKEKSTDLNGQFEESCWGDTGDDVEVFSLPDNAPIDQSSTYAYGERYGVVGNSRADFRAFSSNGNLFHRVDGAFSEEGLPHKEADKTKSLDLALVRSPAGKLFAKQGADSFAVENGCWAKLDDSVPIGTFASETQVLSPSNDGSCLANVP